MHIDAILGGLRTPFQIQIIDCVYQASLNVLGVSETSAKDAFKLTAALAPPPNAYDVIAYHVCHPPIYQAISGHPTLRSRVPRFTMCYT